MVTIVTVLLAKGLTQDTKYIKTVYMSYTIVKEIQCCP